MQRKQRFTACEFDILIEVKPWAVRTKTGLDGGTLTVAYVFRETGLGVKGETVCIPTDEFDFRFGARLALGRALDVHTGKIPTGSPVVSKDTRKEILRAFNKILPAPRNDKPLPTHIEVYKHNHELEVVPQIEITNENTHQ